MNITVALDKTVRKQYFADSPFPSLRKLDLSEEEIVKKAIEESGQDLQAFAAAAIVEKAKRELSYRKRAENLTRKGADAADLKGITGGADKRIEDAYKELKRNGRPITISALTKAIGGNYATVTRWAQANISKEVVSRDTIETARNKRLQEAFQSLKKDKEPITLVALAQAAGTKYVLAKTWAEANIPKEIAPNPHSNSAFLDEEVEDDDQDNAQDEKKGNKPF